MVTGAQMVVAEQAERELRYVTAYEAVARLDEHLAAGYHLRDRRRRLLLTLDQVVAAMLNGEVDWVYGGVCAQTDGG